MDKVNADLDRLLRAASTAAADEPVQAPFGFETRVVALWREQRMASGSWRMFTRLFRRVVFSAALVTLFAGAGAYWQISQNDELTEPSLNAYAIADNAIDAGAWQE